jgi:hypothetical protein
MFKYLEYKLPFLYLDHELDIVETDTSRKTNG